MHKCICVCSVAQLSPTLLWPHGLCSLPGSSETRISQASILQWVAISFSRVFSRLRDCTHVSCIAGRLFNTEPLVKPSHCTNALPSNQNLLHYVHTCLDSISRDSFFVAFCILLHMNIFPLLEESHSWNDKPFCIGTDFFKLIFIEWEFDPKINRDITKNLYLISKFRISRIIETAETNLILAQYCLYSASRIHV